MRCQCSVAALLTTLLTVVNAATWTFDDAQLSITGKSTGVGGGAKQKLSSKAPSTEAFSLSAGETLKITLTTQEGSSAKKPHQAYLQLHDAVTGLEDAYAFSVKENGKAKLELTQKDIPAQLLASTGSLQASIIIASFGSSTPYKQRSFDLSLTSSQGSPAPTVSRPERYGKKEEIHHIFRADPKSPPKIISLVFTLAVLGALPVLLGAWTLLGANVEHFSKAFGAAPIAHGLFLGSILAMEGVFFLYYTSWNLFQTLPAAGVVGVVAYISGSRALTEVQERRFTGQR